MPPSIDPPRDQFEPFDSPLEVRRMGMGNYRELIIGIGRDPAMLVWLDGRFNRTGKPNENYGREVMELFTLGIGNYSEADVKELARCFTGWQLKEGKSVFVKEQF